MNQLEDMQLPSEPKLACATLVIRIDCSAEP